MEFEDEELEKQYSPSQWSKNYSGDSDKIVNHHILTVTKASEETKQKIPCTKNIKYGVRDGQLLDIFGENSLPTDADIFVYIHGGYWQCLNKDISSYCVKPLINSGIKVVIADYDLAPQANMEIIVTEIKELADYVLKMATDCKSRGVWFGGHSAGAHLAAQLILDDYLINLNEKKRAIFKGLVLISGVYDLRPIAHTAVNKLLNLIRKEIELCSPLLQTTNKFSIAGRSGIKALFSVAEYESPAFHRQSQEFAQLLTQCGVEVKYLTLGNEDHFTVVERLEEPSYKMTKEIIRLVKSTS